MNAEDGIRQVTALADRLTAAQRAVLEILRELDFYPNKVEVLQCNEDIRPQGAPLGTEYIERGPFLKLTWQSTRALERPVIRARILDGDGSLVRWVPVEI